MPCYVYRCTSCNYEEEKIEPYTAPEIQDCPACKTKRALKRRIVATSFILKGSGWYADAYSKKG